MLRAELKAVPDGVGDSPLPAALKVTIILSNYNTTTKSYGV
jgi:hypothetical protein